MKGLTGTATCGDACLNRIADIARGPIGDCERDLVRYVPAIANPRTQRLAQTRRRRPTGPV